MAYLLYDHGDSGFSTYFKVLEVLNLISGILLAFNELRPGYALAYSKFTSEFRGTIKQVPSRVGMLVIYTPAVFVGAWFFVDCVLLNPRKPENVGSLKVLLVSAAILIHFLKRDLETLFLHHYSGQTGLTSTIMISGIYTLVAANFNLAQQKSEQLIPPALDLTWLGVVVFFIGLLGNFYHHFLLRGLRKGGDKKYEIPEGGLFGVFVAAHYIFEIVGFIGLALISQTYFSVSVIISVVLYLGSRGYSTKHWYLKKIDGFPENRWVLIPYLF